MEESKRCPHDPITEYGNAKGGDMVVAGVAHLPKEQEKEIVGMDQEKGDWEFFW